MKQIIGYMEYDYMNIKYGMWYMVLIFTIASGMFSVYSGIGAVGYMLFGGLILASTAFNVQKQTVSFTALVPGSILQKVLGRYLGGILCLFMCVVLGVISSVIVKTVGYENGEIEMSMLAGLVGVTLLFLALQNVMLYLLTPVMGVQLVGLIRMIPGFVLFYLVMGAGKTEVVPGVMHYTRYSRILLLAVGVVSLVIAAGISCLILRSRDNE